MAASAPAAAAIPPAAATRPAPAVASTAAEGDAAGPRGKPGFLGNVASHLSPVAKAEAAPFAREAPGGEDWEIQLGAFHDAAAAEEATRHVAGVAAVKGKPHQIIAPAKGDREHLYRARLLNFTGKTAQAACAELHKKKIACTVVRPNGVKVASQ